VKNLKLLGKDNPKYELLLRYFLMMENSY